MTAVTMDFCAKFSFLEMNSPVSGSTDLSLDPLIFTIRGHRVILDADLAKLNEAPNWSQFATSSSLHRGKVYLPWAFTEHGALMAANILRNEKAVQMSIYVVRAFVKLRQQILENETAARRLTEIEWTLRQHDDALIDLYGHLEPLLKPQEESPPGRRMGFQKE